MALQTDILPPRYRSPKRIAQGGMGEVYRATDATLGRAVAVKLLAERYSRDDAVRQRFTREALAAARLSGEPYIVTIFDVGEHAERPFIVMEYLSGGSLEQQLRHEGAQEPGQALEWLEQAALALDAAHRHGVVHRDVKPANLLLDRNNDVHVADFGIASAAGMDSLTMTGTVLGTAGYLSPEQAQGERATAASDRYSLAVVAFELLSGRRPFESESITAEAAAHVNAQVPSIARMCEELPHELDPVFRRALAKNPGERFESAAEFVAAAAPRVRTVTLTQKGTTVQRTVTAPTTPPPPPTPPPAASSSQSGFALNDAGYQKQQAGDYAGALPLLQQAVAKLNGTGVAYEGYANYNLGYTLLQLGRCSEAIQYLERAKKLEPSRHEPKDALKQAKRC